MNGMNDDHRKRRKYTNNKQHKQSEGKLMITLNIHTSYIKCAHSKISDPS